MSNGVFRTPEEWIALNYPGLAVYDPDGWRGPTGRPFTERITESEFEERFARCTVGPSHK